MLRGNNCFINYNHHCICYRKKKSHKKILLGGKIFFQKVDLLMKYKAIQFLQINFQNCKERVLLRKVRIRIIIIAVTKKLKKSQIHYLMAKHKLIKNLEILFLSE